MSLIRQVWMLVVSMIVLACMACVCVSVWTLRVHMQAELSQGNNDNARLLALAITRDPADVPRAERLLATQFGTGAYRRITWKAVDGKVLVHREAAAAQPRAPAWFVQQVALRPGPGTAQLTDGVAPWGQLEVEGPLGAAYEALWSTALRIAAVLAALGLLAALAARAVVQKIRRPLEAMVEQASALKDGRFVTIGEPAMPELRRVAQALNAMVGRVRTMFNEQVEQIEHLRHAAHCDPRTGVADRRHFLDRLQDELASDEGNGRGWLVLMRFQHLGLANQRLGHAATDAMLQAAARGLEQPVQGQLALLAGRLNGSDFAVLFDHTAAPENVLQGLMARAQTAFASFSQAAIVAAAAQWQRGDAAAEVLQAADTALARAELRGHGSQEVVMAAARGPHPIGGEEQWRRGLEQAVLAGRVRLDAYPLVNAAGHTIHHECPLRVGLDDNGVLLPAAVWLPLAVRTGLVARLDRLSAAMALEAIEQDGTPRGINVALVALQDPAFVAALRALVEEHPEAAPRLSIDVDESVLALGMPALSELCRQLRPFGVRVGIEHAGERAAQAQALLAVGLDYIKLRGSFVGGVAGSAAQSALVRGTLAVFHGLGLMVYAEGVQQPEDLHALWMLGLDGVTGPVLAQVTA